MDHLFPHRLTRRDFLRLSATTVTGLALRSSLCAGNTPPAVRLGVGAHTYEWVEQWGKLPTGMKFGFGCGIAVDSSDRIYVTSRSKNPTVAIFDRDGNLLETWGTDFAEKVGYTPSQVADTAHCLYISKEGPGEYIYWTENASTNKEGLKLGKRVYKTDLNGKLLYVIGNVDREGSTAQQFDWSNPTDVAVAPNGDVYVVDGYGSQRVSRFDRNFKHLKTIGSRTEKGQTGPQAPHGTFNTCHGVWVDTRKPEPEVYIADRHNGRIEVFDLDLNYKRTLGHVRNPCCFYQFKDSLYIPDLASRVTILDPKDQLVAHLGDGKETDGQTDKPDNKTNPALFATPHALTVDSQGSIYVVEWVSFGRPRKFRKAVG